MAPKRLQLLYEVIPAAKVMGLLVNPTNGVLAESYTKEVQAAALSLGLELHVSMPAPSVTSMACSQD